MMPAQVTASGKVLLANLPEAELDEILARPVTPLTRRTKTSATAIRKELRQIAARGWALNDEESEVGLRAVAVLAPAERTGIGIDAAITVAGPAERMDAKHVDRIAEVLTSEIAAFSPLR